MARRGGAAIPPSSQGTKEPVDAPKVELQEMDDDQFEWVVKRLIEDAEHFVQQDIQDEREKSWDYYNGGCDLKPREGRSQFVMYEVRDAVESMLPSMIKVFAGTAPPVHFAARRGPQDVPLAKQQTQYCNFIYQQDNPGFVNTYEFCKNALVAKTGIFKVVPDKRREITEERYEGLTQLEMMALLEEDNVEPVEIDFETDQEINGEIPSDAVYDLKLRRVKEDNMFSISVVPPENLLINERAESAEDATIIGENTVEYVSDLVAMGYDFDDIISYAKTKEESADSRDKEREKRSGQVHDDEQVGDPSMYTVDTYQVYVRVDRDGDGYAELHKVLAIGNDKKVLDSETWDEQPYVIGSPYLTPHAAIGKSVGDLMLDLQDLSTQLIRQVLDNLVRANNPQLEILKGQVNLEALRANLYDGLIEVTTKGAINPLVVPFIANQTMPIIEWLQERKELRTGTSKVAQGLDPEALQSSTEVGVASMLSAAQDKILLIARVFAECGFAPLFRKLLRLTIKYQHKARVVRITGNQFVAMDPNFWHADMDVETDVGLGNGSKTEKIMSLQDVARRQEAIIAQMGPQNPYVTPGQYAQTLHDLARETGLSSSTDYWNPPQMADMVAQQMAQQAAQQPDPKQMEIQAKQAESQAKLQLRAQESQAKIAQDERKNQAQIAADERKSQGQLAIQAKQVQARTVLDAQKQKSDSVLSANKQQTENALARAKAREDARLERWKAQQTVRLQEFELLAEAALERARIKQQNRPMPEVNLRRPQ